MQRLHPFADEKKGEVLRRAVFSIADFADTSPITTVIDRPIKEVVGYFRFVALVFGAVAPLSFANVMFLKGWSGWPALQATSPPLLSCTETYLT